MTIYSVHLPTRDDPHARAYLCAGCLRMAGAAAFSPSNARECDECGGGHKYQRAKRERKAWHERLREAVGKVVAR